MPGDTSSLTLRPHTSWLRPALPGIRLALLIAVAAIAVVSVSALSTRHPAGGADASVARVVVPAPAADSARLAPVPAAPAPDVAPPAPAAETSSAQAPALVAETSSSRAPAPVVAAASAAPVAQASASTSPAAATQAETAPPAAVSAPAPVAPAPALPGDRWLAAGFVFVTEGQDWDATSFANVDAALSALPSRVLSQLGNRALGNVNILVNRTGTTLEGKQPYGGAANFFSTNDGHNELVLFPDQSVFTILHELGHSYNLRRMPAGRYALVLLEPEMQSFMAATGWRVLSTPDQVRAARDQLQVQYAYDGSWMWPNLSDRDPLEDFANSFALYFSAPGDLQQKSPQRYAWFEANVGH